MAQAVPIKSTALSRKAGAVINGKAGEAYKIDIDLSPKALEKDTIINLLTGGGK